MDHKELDVWKKSMKLVEEIYKLSNDFPKEEIYGLTSQIRRAAISIPSNSAEGSARKSNKEYLQFLSISLGSLAELETQYLLSLRLGYVSENTRVYNLILEVRKLLLGTRNYLMKI
jgi:four helix bundle protein